MARIGETVEVRFPAPPARPGSSRSLFVRAGGYYEIHLKGEGLPQRNVLATFAEPGAAVRLAVREHQLAMESLAARVAQR